MKRHRGPPGRKCYEKQLRLKKKYKVFNELPDDTFYMFIYPSEAAWATVLRRRYLRGWNFDECLEQFARKALPEALVKAFSQYSYGLWSRWNFVLPMLLRKLFHRERTFDECLEEFCFRSPSEALSNAFVDDPYALSSPWHILWKQHEQLCFAGISLGSSMRNCASKALSSKMIFKGMSRAICWKSPFPNPCEDVFLVQLRTFKPLRFRASNASPKVISSRAYFVWMSRGILLPKPFRSPFQCVCRWPLRTFEPWVKPLEAAWATVLRRRCLRGLFFKECLE